MKDPRKCPKCSKKSEKVYGDVWTDGVEHIRICSDCNIEYTVLYGNPVVEDVRDYD